MRRWLRANEMGLLLMFLLCCFVSGLFLVLAFIIKGAEFPPTKRRESAVQRIEVLVKAGQPLVVYTDKAIRLSVQGNLILEAPTAERAWLGKKLGLPPFGKVAKEAQR